MSEERMIARGAVNAHTHLYSALAPYGMPPPDPAPANFVEILERVWWRLDRALDLPALAAAARLHAAEALLAGTTMLVDHSESPNAIAGSLDVLADACQELGIRAVLGYGATERNGGPDEARAGLAECRRFARANRRPLVRATVALHASFTVGDDTVRAAGRLCDELGLPMHVHVAEAGADVDDARRRGYAGPLERLIALEALPPGSLLAHGVHLDAAQVRLAADRGLWLIQNPRSNEGNRVGYPRALWASSRVALGTDGWSPDMADETDALRRLAAEIPEREPGGADIAAARLANGRALAARFFGESAIACDMFERGPGSRMSRVVVDGRTVVADGRLVTGDLEAIRAEARSQAARLWQRMVAPA